MANILIVEDEPSLQKAYQLVLTAHGFEVGTASNGEEALNKLNDFNADLILLDMNMPKMNGLEFIKTYREEQKGTCKVILLSNFSNTKNIEEAMQFGVADRLLKAEVSPQDLVKVVKDNTA